MGNQYARGFAKSCKFKTPIFKPELSIVEPGKPSKNQRLTSLFPFSKSPKFLAQKSTIFLQMPRMHPVRHGRDSLQATPEPWALPKESGGQHHRPTPGDPCRDRERGNHSRFSRNPQDRRRDENPPQSLLGNQLSRGISLKPSIPLAAMPDEEFSADDLKTVAEVFEILLRWNEEACRNKNGADESDELFPDPEE
ncbi:MAG: hypothetical protein AB1405_15600 [Bdellovibrionota bacterium]